MKVHTKHLSNTSEPPLKRIVFSETCLNQANFCQGLEQRENCFQDYAIRRVRFLKIRRGFECVDQTIWF